MRMISFIILVSFLFTNTAYPSSTLRIPVQGSKRAGKTLDILTTTEGTVTGETYIDDAIKTRPEMLKEVVDAAPEEIRITLYDYKHIEAASETYGLEQGLYELEKSPFLHDKEFVVRRQGQNVEVLCLDLPQMGSTEYNTWTLGAGRIVKQSIVSLDEQFTSGAMSENRALRNYLESAKGQGYAHIVGILQEAGVHASKRHIYHLIRYLKENGINRFVFDLASDGRDEGANNCLVRVRQLRAGLEYFGVSDYVINIRGREICFDRAKNWDLTEAWINELLWGSRISRKTDQGKTFFPPDILRDDLDLFEILKETSDSIYSEIDDTIYVWDADGLERALQEEYAGGKNDEVMTSIITIGEDGVPQSRLHEGGAILDINFRKDRQKQWVSAIVDPGFNGFEVSDEAKNIEITGMTQYVPDLPEDRVILGDIKVENGLAEVLNREGINMVYVFDAEKGKFIPNL